MAVIKLTSYPSWQTITFGIAGKTADSTLLNGRASTAVSNTTDLFLDVHVAGKFRSGTSPTAGIVEIWAYASIDGSTNYPDGITGTDADKTITSVSIKNSGLRPLWVTQVDNVSDRDYFMPPTSIATAYGGQMPSNWGLFLVHNTTAALNSTAGNHAFAYRGFSLTST